VGVRRSLRAVPLPDESADADVSPREPLRDPTMEACRGPGGRVSLPSVIRDVDGLRGHGETPEEVPAKCGVIVTVDEVGPAQDPSEPRELEAILDRAGRGAAADGESMHAKPGELLLDREARIVGRRDDVDPVAARRELAADPRDGTLDPPRGVAGRGK